MAFTSNRSEVCDKDKAKAKDKDKAILTLKTA